LIIQKRRRSILCVLECLFDLIEVTSWIKLNQLGSCSFAETLLTRKHKVIRFTFWKLSRPKFQSLKRFLSKRNFSVCACCGLILAKLDQTLCEINIAPTQILND